MSWARALGEFGATIMFAGNVEGRTQTLPLVVYCGVPGRRPRRVDRGGGDPRPGRARRPRRGPASAGDGCSTCEARDGRPPDEPSANPARGGPADAAQCPEPASRDGHRRDRGPGDGRGVVTVDGGHEVVAAITAESARRAGLVPGSEVTVIVKSTEVMLAVDD